MNEIELKLQVPPSKHAAFEAAVVGRAPAPRMHLQAAYYDTAARDLARAGLALRLRREGRHWVQTLKGAADDGMTRLEHNVPRGGGTAPPLLDPVLHAGTPAGERLVKLLGGLSADALLTLYGTDISRRTRQLVVRMVDQPQATVELAFDTGRIVAGDATLPVCEFEIELVAGSPLAVVEVARRWLPRHGLWLDTRSKAERGDLLARGQSMSPARLATVVRLKRRMTWSAARQAVLRSCADQILANASQIASGDHGADHVHQLRVGLRRLRSALALFDIPTAVNAPGSSPPARSVGAASGESLGKSRGGLVVDSMDEPLRESSGEPTGRGALAVAVLGESTRRLFRDLGAARDQAVIDGEFSAELAAAMRSAGVLVESPRQAGLGSSPPTLADLLRQPHHQDLLLDLIKALQASGPRPDDADADASASADTPAAPLRTLLSVQLERWHREVVRDARRYGRLDDEQRHRLRKRAKRLRYAAEFSADLFKVKAARRYLKTLRALQERLGAVSDVLMAMHAFGQRGAADSQAMFALGWLAAHRERLLLSAGPELKAFGKLDGFWK